MPSFRMAVLNAANVPDEEVTAFVQAAEEYIDKYLVPFWPDVGGSRIRCYPLGVGVGGDVPLVLAPNTTQAGSLGFHDKTATGLPTGIVELDSCRRYGVPWTVAATHEIAELLIDPYLTQFVQIGPRSYPKEIADPVTANRFMIGTVAVANVTTPAYWDPHSPPGSRFDIMGLATAPLPTIPKDGWLEWSEGGQYQNAWGPEMPARHVAYMAERHGRRFRRRMMGTR